MNTNPQSQYRRIIIRRANEYVLFKTEDIAYFYLENKTCFMVDRLQGIKYLIPKSLRDLTMALDPADFYRINKKYLVHIDSLRKFKLCVAGRIEVELYPVPGKRFLSTRSGCRISKNGLPREVMNNQVRYLKIFWRPTSVFPVTSFIFSCDRGWFPPPAFF